MQHEVGHAEYMRQMLLFDARDAILNRPLIRSSLGLLAQVLDGAY